MSVELGLFQDLVGFNFATDYVTGTVHYGVPKTGPSPLEAVPYFDASAMSLENSYNYSLDGGGAVTVYLNQVKFQTWLTHGVLRDTGESVVFLDNNYWNMEFYLPVDQQSGQIIHGTTTTYPKLFFSPVFRGDSKDHFLYIDLYGKEIQGPPTFGFVRTGRYIEIPQNTHRFISGSDSVSSRKRLLFFTTGKVSNLPAGGYYEILFINSGKRLNIRYGRIRTANDDIGSKAIDIQVTGYTEQQHIDLFSPGEPAKMTVRQGTPSVPYDVIY
jgi:hypothetical protein